MPEGFTRYFIGTESVDVASPDLTSMEQITRRMAEGEAAIHELAVLRKIQSMDLAVVLANVKRDGLRQGWAEGVLHCEPDGLNSDPNPYDTQPPDAVVQFLLCTACSIAIGIKSVGRTMSLDIDNGSGAILATFTEEQPDGD